MASGVTQSRNVRSRYRCSMCPAIHINSRSWLRPSSTHEPSDPPPRVVCFLFLVQSRRWQQLTTDWPAVMEGSTTAWFCYGSSIEREKKTEKHFGIQGRSVTGHFTRFKPPHTVPCIQCGGSPLDASALFLVTRRPTESSPICRPRRPLMETSVA